MARELTSPVQSATRHYRHLLRLYPRQFRQDFGHEMQQVFADYYRDKRSAGDNMLEFWIKIYVDTGVNAMAQQVHNRSARNTHAFVRYITKGILAIGALGSWLAVYITIDKLPVANWYSMGGLDGFNTIDGNSMHQVFIYPWYTLLANLILWAVMSQLLWRSQMGKNAKRSLIVAGLIIGVVLPKLLFTKGNIVYASQWTPLELWVLGNVAFFALLGHCVWRIRTQHAPRRATIFSYSLAIVALAAGLVAKLLTLNRNDWFLYTNLDIIQNLLHHTVSVVLAILVVGAVLFMWGVRRKQIASFAGVTLLVASFINLQVIFSHHNVACSTLVQMVATNYQQANPLDVKNVETIEPQSEKQVFTNQYDQAANTAAGRYCGVVDPGQK